ncbi:hypothetical protein D3C77_450290 [compost metagenome]
MANHRLRSEAPFQHHSGDRIFYNEDNRLGNIRLIDSIVIYLLLYRRVQCLLYPLGGLIRQQFQTALNLITEYGYLLVQFPPHFNILRTLTRKHKYNRSVIRLC